MPEPDEIVITGERSETPEALEEKINQELGLPSTPKTTEEAPAEEPENPEPAADEETPTEPETPEEVEEPETPTEPATPSDEELFIEVEDAEGVTHKISKVEDLPEDFQLKNNRQGIEILSQLAKLETKIAERDAEIAKNQEEAVTAKAQADQFAAWDKEIDTLAKDKRIDVKDTDRINKVFEHIAEINDARAKVGNTNFITSFEDGLDKFEAAEAKAAEATKNKEETDKAKLKSNLLGRGNSPASGESRPYVAGSYKSIDDVPLD